MTTIERNQRLLEALRIDWVKMLSDEQSKDLQILVGPAEEGVVSAHRLVLLARCEKLQKRLRRAGNSTLRFPELDLQATKAVIRYLYTSKIELKEITELCRLLPVCHSLGLPGLHSYLLERARAQLTPSAVTHLLAAAITRADESEEQALRDDLQEVVELCMEFIVTHKATVLRSDAFLTSDRNVVARIASSPQFQTCSGEVWSAIMRWSKAKAGVSALQSDWLDEEWDMVREEMIEVLREMGVVKDNIKLTRELLFSADKMQELLERHQELNAEENDSGRDEIFCSSTLLACREDLQTQIQEWTGHAGKQWQLLFRATSDGFSGRSFHHLCDNRGPTVVVVKTAAGHLFGGYTDIAWNSHYRRGKFSSSNRAFLFSLTSPSSNSPPAKFDIHQPAYAINNHPGNGPIFGSGADLFISSNCERCEDSYSMLTCSYGNPKTHPPSLAGTKYFVVEDYEVFGLSV